MPPTNDSYDVLVVGAGMGGICAAVLLAERGYRTLLVERLDRIGGRASTEEIDGFLVNTGAAAFEFGGALEELCGTVGVTYGATAPTDQAVRVPKRSVVLRLGPVTVNLTPVIGGWANGMLRWICKVSLARLPRASAKRGLRTDELTFEAWLSRFTKNKQLHAMLRNPLASFFVTDEHELPAAAVFTFFSEKTGLRKFGFHPAGSIGVARALTDRFLELGGQLSTATEVRGLRVEDGLVTGAVLVKDGAEVDIDCAIAISDTGPRNTVELVGAQHFTPEYLKAVQETRAAALMAVNFATRKPLGRFGAMTFGRTKHGRLLEVINFTATCPEMAPEGWHLYVGWGLPATVAGDFDSARESELLIEDLRAMFPAFGEARVLSVAVNRDAWPGQHAAPGTDIARGTPIANLWNVGDGVKDFGDGGMESVAKTSCAVVEEIVASKAVGSRS
ncbi:NAD(P)/FAD-dependent oxidoreductase [Nocardia sp. NBC_01499]|uniref:phytoene desaturase family protein n=1 Tax=Nocardia sp. NBC_01499 TaxID=2903597 RepID=UPI003863D56B